MPILSRTGMHDLRVLKQTLNLTARFYRRLPFRQDAEHHLSARQMSACTTTDRRAALFGQIGK
jgi:hypothetical protein